MQHAVGCSALAGQSASGVVVQHRQQQAAPLPRRLAACAPGVFTQPSHRAPFLPKTRDIVVRHTWALRSSSSGGRPEQQPEEGPVSYRVSSQLTGGTRLPPQQHTHSSSHQDLLQPLTFSFSNGTSTPLAPVAAGTQSQPSSEPNPNAYKQSSEPPSPSSPLLSQHQQQQQHPGTSPAEQPQQSHLSTQHSPASSAPSSSQPAESASNIVPAPPSTSSSTPSSQQQPHSPSPDAEVDSAVERAQAALNQLESSLDHIHQLPSANLHSSQLPMPPLQRKSRLTRMMGVLRTLAVVSGASVALVASHAFGLAIQLLSAVAGALAISYWGHRRGSLSASGAVTAFMVGVGTLCCSLRFGATLLAFFYASSKLSHFKEEVKAKLDDSSKKGGQRDWKQVLCNGLVPTGIAVAYGLVAGCVDVPLGPSAQLEVWRAKVLTLLAGAYLGWYSCCCGDTWASELGPLSQATPRLITSMRPVRRGTNGGVTLLGLAASAAGGTFIGLVFYLFGLVSPTLWIFEAQRATAARQWLLIPLGLLAGLVGSLVDSLLGATVQFSGFNHNTQRVTSTPGPNVTRITGHPLLNNNLVNVVSATTNAALMACVAFWAFGV